MDATHPDFNAPLRITGDFPSSLIDIVGHGTHVAGTIMGNGSKSATISGHPLRFR